MSSDIFAEMGLESDVSSFCTWEVILEAIRDRCGEVLEFKDETIIQKLTRQINPYYSKHKPHISYYIVQPKDIITTEPKIQYKINKKFISQIEKVHIPNQMGYIHNNYLEIAGYSGGSLEDILISENYTQMFQTILPTTSWNFRAPDILEVTFTNTQSHEVRRSGYSYPAILLELGLVHLDLTTIDPNHFEMYKKLCVGYMMATIGAIRAKADGLSTPMGTIQTDGQTLKQDGENMLREAKQSLEDTPHQTPLVFF